MKRVNNTNLVKRLTITIGGVVTLILLSLIFIVIAQVYSSSVKDTHVTFETKAELNANKVQEVISVVDSVAKNLQSYIKKNFNNLKLVLDRTNGLNSKVKFSMVYGTLIDESKIEIESYILNTAWAALETNKNIGVLAVYLEPYVFDSTLFTYGVEVSQENLKSKTITPIFSYDKYAHEEFYLIPQQTLKPHTTNPIIDENGNIAYYISYPIIHKDEFKGVIVTNILSSSFDDIIPENTTYSTLFSSIFNQNWDTIYDSVHPELINTNISEIIVPKDMAKWQKLGEQKEPFYVKTQSIDGKKYERYLYPIGVTDTTWWAHISVESKEFYSKIWTLIMLISSVSIVSLLILIFVTRHVLTKALKPLNQVVSAATQISHGNLDISLNLPYQDEIGVLGQEFKNTSHSLKEIIFDIEQVLDQMAQGDFTATRNIKANYTGAFHPIKISLIQISEKLSETLSNIISVSKKVSRGAENIAKGSIELANGTIEQSAIVQNFKGITEEIEQGINITVNQAKETSKISIEAKQKASHGTAEMENMLLSMSEINKSSQIISDVLKTVSDISTQTNLLALNASIEAARAGENGKGFAVVADEIRNLAIRSNETVQEIEKILKKSMSDISKGQDMANNTALSLQAIVATIEKTTLVSEELLKTSNSQKYTLENLVSGTNQISALIQTNTSTSQEAAAISEELAKQAEYLFNLIHYFKILK
ncbi:hypothetical protein AN640_02295 [Candidatus Epulonipiscium fishelsonii]|uniref:Uncharacterized protein n=1 Tax=Candidatus Epulonipiscium fishelsonii TaxID=77094 RepID=A0ACC8X9B2_9FIRM|nr:hypothetical protein AN640_02295 [Epulopiscium sp. SCG-D08WGA-EpuloA1]OON92829.1 MAG: hypothetical protein ATN32_09325 [Epulopiscium sp. AS2M-Bin002]